MKKAAGTALIVPTVKIPETGAIARRILEIAEQYGECDVIRELWGLSFTNALESHETHPIETELPLPSKKMAADKGAEIDNKRTIKASALYGATWNAFLRTQPILAQQIKDDPSLITLWETTTLAYVEYLIHKNKYPRILIDEELWLWQVALRVVVLRIMEAKYDLEERMLKEGHGSGYGFKYPYAYGKFDCMMLMWRASRASARGARGAFNHRKEENTPPANVLSIEKSSSDKATVEMHDILNAIMQKERPHVFPELASLPTGAPRIRFLQPRPWVMPEMGDDHE